MIVQHNMAAENTSRQIGKNVRTNVTSMERLSSGYRINRAADDAAGLSVSEKMRGQIRGLKKGSLNCGDGMNLIQVADGALQEVHTMLDRLKELSVQAGNDTLVDEDRQSIQYEVELLLDEIDRIGDETEFNTIKVFLGSNVGENSLGANLLKFKFSTSKEDYRGPTGEGTDRGLDWHSRNLPLFTQVENPDGTVSYWKFINDGGATSAQIRFVEDTGNGREIVGSDILAYSWGQNSVVATEDLVSRKMSCKGTTSTNHEYDITCTQKLVIPENNNPDYEYFEISYTFENNKDTDVKLDFLFMEDTMFCPDTLPSNGGWDNEHEAYYMNGSRIEETGIIDNPSGISVCNTKYDISFSEKVDWDTANKPTKLGVSAWDDNWEFSTSNDPEDAYQIWDDIDNENGLFIGTPGYHDHYQNDTHEIDDRTGEDRSIDMALALIWEDKVIPAGESVTITWRYGVASLSSDSNVPSDFVRGTATPYSYPANGSSGSTISGSVQTRKNLWIQSGANSHEGEFLELRAMNRNVLGLSGLSMLSVKSATDANSRVDKAIEKVSDHRAYFGAKYNGLEHMRANDDNTGENLQASESKIRDTDFAQEMVMHAAKEILIQAGQAMLVQTNNVTQGVLTLLR